MLRRAMAAGFEDAAHERQYRVNKPPTYSAMRLAITPPTHALDPQESVETPEPRQGHSGWRSRAERHPTEGPNGQWAAAEEEASSF